MIQLVVDRAVAPPSRHGASHVVARKHATMSVSQEALQPELRVDLRVTSMTLVSSMTTSSTVVAVSVKLVTNVHVMAAPYTIAAHLWSRSSAHDVTLLPGILVGVGPTRAAKIARHTKLRLPVNFFVL